MSNYSDALFEANREIEEWKRRYDEATKAAGELLLALKAAAELIGELREYCRESWDWKYGERWDESMAAVARAIEAAERAGVK